MYNPHKKKIIPVPINANELKRGLVMEIIKEAVTTEKLFLKLK